MQNMETNVLKHPPNYMQKNRSGQNNLFPYSAESLILALI